MSDTDLLRHTLATLAYRAQRVIVDVPPGFEGTTAGGSTRGAGHILAHIGDVLDWADRMAIGDETWEMQAATDWDSDVQRIYAALGRLDERVVSGLADNCPAERLFQGPLADALTHIGQLAMLRRVAGSPVAGENFFVADVAGEYLTEFLECRAEVHDDEQAIDR